MRLSRGPYLLLWLLLSGAQIYAFTLLPEMGGPKAFGLIAALQALKALNAIPRLSDLGRPGDDALLALIPLASLGLFMQLNGPTPTEAVRVKRRGAWVDEPSAMGLYWDGLKTLFRYPSVAFGLAIPFAAGAAFVDLYLLDIALAVPAGMDDGGDTLGLIFLLVGAFLFLYFLLQVGKRSRASRASWWPALMIMPVMLLAVASYMGGVKDFDLLSALGNPQGADQFMPYVVGTQALWLLYALIPGGIMATAWAVVAADSHGATSGFLSPLEARESTALSRIAKRFPDVGAVNGAVILSVTLGMLILVPGIIYALQYAFVPVRALSRPDEAALAGSASDSRPIRRRLFKVLFLGFVVDIACGVGLIVLFTLSGGGELGSSLGFGIAWLFRQIPPGLTSLSPLAIGLITLVTTWVWGASRIGIAKAWLIREDAAAPALDESAA